MGRLECDWPPSRLRGSQRRKLLQGRRIWLMPCTRKRRKSADPGSWTIRQMQDRVQALLDQRRQGCSLPQAFYVDEEMFQADLQAVFAADWLFACNACEIKNPGDYITLAIGQDSLVVLRDRDGEVRAFHNICRHRGSRICLDETRSREPAGLPLSSMGLRARRQAAQRTPDARGFRHGRLWSQAGAGSRWSAARSMSRWRATRLRSSDSARR